MKNTFSNGFGPVARTAALLLFAALILSPAACEFPEFDPPNIIKNTRILGIRVEPREAAPGQEVTVTALAVHDDGTPSLEPVAWMVTASISLSYGALEDIEDIEDLPLGEMYLQPPGGAPFTFTIPEKDKFAEKYGEYFPIGTVLTIAMAYGDPKKDPTIGFKSLIVMDNPSKENPVFNEIEIIVDGEKTEPGDDGVYLVGNVGRIKLIADVDFPTGDERTFHWYTATEGIEFNVEKATSWRLPKEPGLYDLYCVARENSKTTIGDGEFRIQSTGMDWKHAVIEITAGEDE